MRQLSCVGDCYTSTEGKMTNCGEYFVYYLENTPWKCELRYCATIINHFETLFS